MAAFIQCIPLFQWKKCEMLTTDSLNLVHLVFRCRFCFCDVVKLQFIGPRQFCLYNMFNHYFFGGDASRSAYLEFLRKCLSQDADDLLVVIDPPFGGHVAVIAFTLKCITDDYRNVHQGMHAIVSF